MDTTIIIQSVCLVLLILLSAFFSSAETSLTTVNKIKIRTLVEEGDKRAIRLTKVYSNSAKMLSAILVGNNIVNISASALSTTLAIRIWGNTVVGIVTGVLTIVILVFGEITPKTIATIHSEEIALSYAGVILFLMKAFTPIIFIIDKIALLLLFVLHIDPKSADKSMTETELKTIVDVSHEDGVIESSERKMIYNVFDFGDSCAKDIMIPRINVCSIELSSTYDEILEVFKNEKYTRLPVYEEDTDNIVGLINMKDFLLYESRKFFKVRDILRDVYFTYESKKTSELMMELKKSTLSMAIVLNEYGGAEGIITMEDLLEEIVGEIRDEYDEDEFDLIKTINEHEYLVEGSLKLDDLNDALSLSLESEDYDSVGGLIIGLLDRLPDAGESVSTPDGIILEVVSTSKNKIDQVHLYLPDTQQEDETIE